MQATEVRPKTLHVVLLYDPITVNTVSIDSIKSSTPFKTISLLSDDVTGGILALASEMPQLKVIIQSNRLEYSDEESAEFPKRKLDELWKLIRLLPKFSIKAYGLNFILGIIPNSDSTAGRYISDKYIKNGSDLESKLKQPILSASIRLFLGTPDHHRDLRLTPEDFSAKALVLQYHLHRDIPIADTDKLIQTVEESFVNSWRECEDWFHQLP